MSKHKVKIVKADKVAVVFFYFFNQRRIHHGNDHRTNNIIVQHILNNTLYFNALFQFSPDSVTRITLVPSDRDSAWMAR